ncbi:MAG: putative ATP-grasp-modified RiPP [Pseudonocardiales bacterium]|nr:putative ATP-grasp-modified RiPP [Pseudonocardiales bacterium]
MPDPLAPLWRDPLFSPGDRFPLGPPHGIVADCQEGPSGPATRPFSLRHVVAGARLDQAPRLHWMYCPDQQVAIVYDEDGSLVPYEGRHTRPGATPGLTTGYIGGPDGAGPGDEEVGDPDYQAD